MSSTGATVRQVMGEAIEASLRHVDAGGLPFVGVVVDATGEMISGFGVNRVLETGDPTAHAEVVAMRDAEAARGPGRLAGSVLLATGEPCGLCYRYAIDRGIDTVLVAVDRDEVARHGFDYRAGYTAFGVTDEVRAEVFRSLPVPRATTPFTRYAQRCIPGGALARPGTISKGTPSS